MKVKKKKQKGLKAETPATSPKITSEPIQKAAARLWFIPVLLVCVCVAYWNSLHGQFLFDDLRLIRFNFTLRDLANWQDIFLSERFRPLLAWTFALNYRLTAQDPVSYHVFNVGFHALSIVLFYSFLRRQTASPWLPVAAAALMAVHPLNTESVSYIASRSTVLCSVFYFSALLFFDAYLRTSRKKFVVGYIVCFLLGATVKEEAAMIPVLALLYHIIYPGQETIRKKLGIHILTGTLLVAGSVFRVWMQLKYLGAPPHPMSTWIPSEISIWLRYLALAFYPFGLNMDPEIAPIGFSNPGFWISGVVIALLCGVAWRGRKRNPFLAFWVLWFFLNLLPSSVFPLNDLMAEHRAYISTFGFAACAGYFLIEFALTGAQSYPARATLAAVLIGFCAFLTIQRNAVWASEITLWRDSAAKSPGKVRPRLNLASGYMKNRQYDDAIREFHATLALNQNVPLAYSGLGVCYLQKGEVPPAEENFKKALALQPELTDAKVGLATVFYRQKNYSAALKLFDQVYAQRQASIPIAAMMADSNIRLKNFDRAIPFLERGIVLDPNTPGWYFRLMESHYLAGRYPEALRVFDQYSSRFLTTGKYKMRVANMLLGMQRVSEGVALLQGLAKDPEYSADAQKQLQQLGRQ